MTDTDTRQVLVRLPAQLPLDLVSAIGNYISAALPGAMLGPGDGRGNAADVFAGGDLSMRETVERLRHATAAVEGVEYVPSEDDHVDDGLVLNRLTVDESGVVVGVGGNREVAERAAKNLLAAFIPYLDEQGATNYLQWDVMIPQRDEHGNWVGPDQRFAFIVVRPGKKSPHELRRDAEAELEKLRKRRTRKPKSRTSPSDASTDGGS